MNSENKHGLGAEINALNSVDLAKKHMSAIKSINAEFGEGLMPSFVQAMRNYHISEAAYYLNSAQDRSKDPRTRGEAKSLDNELQHVLL